MKKAFIHTMRTSKKCYLYDVNTRTTVPISEQLFKELNEKDCDIDKIDLPELNHLLHKGFLKDNHVSVTKHCETDYLPYYLANKMNTLILQVTRTCNLRCEYCAFTGLYQNRRHEDKFMSWDLAKRGIDYLMEHSRDSDRISISFYGGEPLMAFELIKKCVNYANDIFEGKKVRFNMTTNATLLKGDTLKFLVENDIDVMVSLDGAKEYHDKHRRFVDGNRGSFEVLMENVKHIKQKYPDYYENCITYNTVLDPERSFKKVDEFIMNDEILRDSHFSYSIIDDHYTEHPRIYSEEFVQESNYTIFLQYLSALNLIKTETITKIYNDKLSELNKIRQEGNRREELPRCWHHGGPCITGLFHTFLNLKGEFYPCEKISELSEICKIGNIDTGIDVEKAKKLLNIETYTTEECKECWAYDYCQICALHGDAFSRISKEKILKECPYIKRRTENILLDCCVLEELGYDFQTYSSHKKKGNVYEEQSVDLSF